MNLPENNIIALQVDKEITDLFKSFLEILEETEKDPEKYAILRKRVLGKGNDKIRHLLEFLGYFDFQINNQKLEEALKNKVTNKKIVIGSLISVE
jgi:UDP-2,3-diacylglucosamine pyrophosphatase LpxH